MAQEEGGRIGFDHYVTRDNIWRRLEEGKKEKLVIEPTDTKHTHRYTQGVCMGAGG